MELKEMIQKRRSVRSYTGVPVEKALLERITAFIPTMKPLYPGIRVRAQIVTRERVKCILPWTTPQLVAIYSQDQEGYLENVGFLYQQLDLYLQSMGLGVCWLGMGRVEEKLESRDGLKFVMLLAFGHPKADTPRKGPEDFRRKSLDAISDRPDPRLEPARLAPSSVNSQPWYFLHQGDTLHVYCVRQGLLKNKAPGEMNRIDVGIALAHMYVANPATFRFFRSETPLFRKGYGYMGSFTIS